MHILVVEDEKVLCETIVRSLRRLDYSVDSCYDGNEAIELLSIESYDLVLLDLNLPGTDGMTVLRKLRQTDRDTKVLILSARSEVADKVDGLDSGANDYLSFRRVRGKNTQPDTATVHAKRRGSYMRRYFF